MSFVLYTLHMYYMYRLLNYIIIEQGRARMDFYRFIGLFFRLEKENFTVFTSLQHKIIFFSKSQPRVYSENILKISQISVSISL